MSMNVRVGGVPEHFNLPWHLAIEAGDFAQREGEAVTVEWIDLPGGTGEIMEALATGRIDMATPLTEGVVTAIANGNPSELVSIWVDSPLNWGVFAAAQSDAKTVADLEGTRFAISRYGSGSELMSLVMADELGWALSEDSFVVVGGLDGALEALPAGAAEIFMWEKAMTQPHVEAGIFSLVGEYPTPWPGFVVAQTTSFAEANPGLGRQIVDIAAATAQRLAANPDAVDLITERYELSRPEVSEWFEAVQWTAPGTALDDAVIERVRATMIKLGRIETS